MVCVHFTAWLRQHVPHGPLYVEGATVNAALFALFTEVPHVRGYLLDEQGRLRKHVCIFADGARLPRDTALAHPLRPDSELHVMQALSGG